MLNKATEREGNHSFTHSFTFTHSSHILFLIKWYFSLKAWFIFLLNPPNIDLLLSYCLHWVFESWQRKRQKRSSKSGSKFSQIKAQNKTKQKNLATCCWRFPKWIKERTKKRWRVQSGKAELQVGIKRAEPQSTRCLTPKEIDKQKSPHYFFVIKNVPLLLANTVISHCLVTALGFKGRKIIITDQNAQACIYKQQLLFPGARGGRTNKCEKRDDVLGHIPAFFWNG